MADIGQVCRRPPFNILDLPPFQTSVLRVVPSTRSSLKIKIEIDKNRQRSSSFYRLITENGENLSKEIF